MLVLISWRNVWRQKSRSFVVIGSIVVAIWALIFMVAFMNGFTVSYINGAIKYEISHIQIHNPDFKTDLDIRFTIPDADRLGDSLQSSPLVQGVTVRSVTNGMVSSSRKAGGVKIIGVDPLEEASVTHHDSSLVEGTYFEGIKRNPAVMGKRLAEELGVKVRSKIVLTFQDVHRNITAGAFRVTGLIETTSPVINDASVYVRRSDLNSILGMDDAAHEIAVLLETPDHEDEVLADIKSRRPELLVESWRQISPELELFLTMTDSFLWVLLGIIMTALVFGIINSMLMAVLERFKELGMLMAVGMNKARVFSMIVLETIYLALVGGPLGLALGYLTISALAKTGIDLSRYSEGLRQFGYDTILYPFIEASNYGQIAIGVMVTALIAAIYPAFKAVKLSPVEALHKI